MQGPLVWDGGGWGDPQVPDVACMLHPPPFARTTVKALKMTEATPPVALTRALCVRTVRRHTQHSNASSRPRPPCLQRCIKVTYGMRGRGGGGGRKVISIPEIPSPSPKSQETLGLHGETRKGSAKFHGYNSYGNDTSCCSHRRGGGVPIPLAITVRRYILHR